MRSSPGPPTRRLLPLPEAMALPPTGPAQTVLLPLPSVMLPEA